MNSIRLGAMLTAGLGATGASAATFDIAFDLLGETPSAYQAALLSDAEAFWEGLVPGYQASIDIGQLLIKVALDEIDGPGNILATAGPTMLVQQSGFFLPTNGSITFDLDDAFDLDDDTLFGTLVHEIAHVMGFGTLWGENGLYTVGTGKYTGAQGVAAYRAEFDLPDADFVPVEVMAGSGSDDYHWAEDWAGGPFELMTSFIEPPFYLSDTTLASLRDIGYVTVPAVAPVPLPAGVWLGLGAFGTLGAVGARRRPARNG